MVLMAHRIRGHYVTTQGLRKLLLYKVYDIFRGDNHSSATILNTKK